MKRYTLQKNIIYIILVVLLLIPFAVSAQFPLEVAFTPNPLFSEANFLPVDDSIGTAEVTNNSGVSQTILAASANVTDPDGLGNLPRLFPTQRIAVCQRVVLHAARDSRFGR